MPQLRDVNCEGRRDGGFNCIPGSHRASVPFPDSVRRASGSDGPDGLFLDPDPLWDSRHLVLPEMRAGDLLFFMGAGMVRYCTNW